MGKDIFKEFDYTIKLLSLSDQEKKNYQKQKLRKLLLHCYDYVPYYRQLFDELNLARDGDELLDKFTKLPILTKEAIRKNFDSLQSEDSNYRARKPYLNTSGGSTGEPVKLVQDKDVWTKGMASSWVDYYLITGNVPCKLIKLWGSERDILKGSQGITGYLKNWVYRRIILNAFKMSEEDMFRFVKKINAYKPELIEAYVHSLYELSKFIKQHKLEVHTPKGIIVSAGTLYPEMKELIEQTFNCKVYNRYGSREVGHMACSRGEDELHISFWHNHLEILNDKLEPCKEGEVGKIYVTNLNNYSMPLLRYEIGDIAERKNVLTLKSVLGRSSDHFVTKKGKKVHGAYFRHAIFFKDWVKNYQIIQEDYERVVFKVVPTKKYVVSKKEHEEIEQWVQKGLTTNTKVEIQLVDKIEALKSGKYRYTMSKVK